MLPAFMAIAVCIRHTYRKRPKSVYRYARSIRNAKIITFIYTATMHATLHTPNASHCTTLPHWHPLHAAPHRTDWRPTDTTPTLPHWRPTASHTAPHWQPKRPATTPHQRTGTTCTPGPTNNRHALAPNCTATPLPHWRPTAQPHPHRTHDRHPTAHHTRTGPTAK